MRRSFLPPPAASSVYELSEQGEACRPAVYELIRWGGRFLQPRRRKERVEPDWMRLGAGRAGEAPGLAGASLPAAGPRGQEGSARARRRRPRRHDGHPREAPADATLVLDVPTLLVVATGRRPLADAISAGAVEATGDRAALTDFADLFDPPAR